MGIVFAILLFLPTAATLWSSGSGECFTRFSQHYGDNFIARLEETIRDSLYGEKSFLHSFLKRGQWVMRDDGSIAIFKDDVDKKTQSKFVFLSTSQFEALPCVKVPTLTFASEALVEGMSKGKPKGRTWAAHRNGQARSFLLPKYHPRQYRKVCSEACYLASRGLIRLYTPWPVQRPEYTLYLTNAVIASNGIVANHEGYVHFREGCEPVQKKAGLLWHRELLNQFTESFMLDRNSTAPDIATVWEAPFQSSSLQYLSERNERAPMTKPMVETALVIDALWDYNFHHALVDSVARLVHWYDYLVAHPDIYVHIRHYDEVKKMSRADRRKYRRFRKTLFTFLGIDPKRLVSGEVAARQVLLPRSLGCGVYVKHKSTLHKLREVLQKRSKLFGCSTMKKQPGRKLAIIQVRDCPMGVVRFWRCINATQGAVFQEALESVLKDEWTIRTTDHFPSKGSSDVEQLACSIQEYAEADMIVGVHGAGMTNMMFMKPGGIVIEIIGQFDGRMTPICGFHGPLASVYDIHHYIYYYDSYFQDINFRELRHQVKFFIDSVASRNQNKSLMTNTPEFYFDRKTKFTEF